MYYLEYVYFKYDYHLYEYKFNFNQYIFMQAYFSDTKLILTINVGILRISLIIQ